MAVSIYTRPVMADPADAATAITTRLAAGFLQDAEHYAAEMVERIRDELPEFAELASEPELWEALHASCLANLHTGLDRMAGDRSIPDAIPGRARDLARIAVHLDLGLEPVLRAYRVGHRVMWEAWFAAIEAEADGAEDRRRVHEEVSGYLFAYVDRVSGLVTDEFTRERDRFLRSREQRRTQLVRDVLEGADPDPARALDELGYDLRLHHLALVASGPEPERSARELAGMLEAPHRLVVSLADDTAWAWVGRTRPFAVPASLEPPEGTGLALGDPGEGIEGFRRSHRQARDAHAVALRSGAALTRYDAVALESLVATDEDRMRSFIARELRGLDGRDKRSRRLRATLRAYFTTGQNAAAAAALLGVHDHTVAYRLRAVEEEIGRPVATRRAELETALRLLAMLEG